MVDAIAGAVPPYKSRLPECPLLTIFPNAGPWNQEMAVIPFYEDYQAVADGFGAYADIPADLDALIGEGESTYADLTKSGVGMAPASGSGGWGLAAGVLDQYGTEIWLTNVEGWDSGAVFQANTNEGQLSSGTQITYVLGRGREITVSGALYNREGGEDLLSSQKMLASALATEPHRGWLYLDGLWMPVALDGQIKQERIDISRVDFEFTLRGRDGVSPGHGVYREMWPELDLTVTGGTSSNTGVSVNEGVVGIHAHMDYVPLDAEVGSVVSVTVGDISEQVTFKELPDGYWLRFDSAHRTVTLMSGEPHAEDEVEHGSARGYVDWPNSDWVEVPVGSADWKIVSGSAGTYAQVHWNGLF